MLSSQALLWPLVATLLSCLLFIPALLIWYRLLGKPVEQQKLVEQDVRQMDAGERWKLLREDPDGEFFKQVNDAARSHIAGPRTFSLSDRLFQAGYYLPEQQNKAQSKLLALAVVLFVLLFLVTIFTLPEKYIVAALVSSLAFSLYGANALLHSWISNYHQRIQLYLPVTIEQLAVGIVRFAGVDQAIIHLTNTAVTRGNINPVAALFSLAIRKAREEKVSLKEVLADLGARSGHLQLKHVFIQLSRIMRDGSGYVKQLRDLATKTFEQEELQRSTGGHGRGLGLLATTEGISALRRALIPPMILHGLQVLLTACGMLLAWSLHGSIVQIFALGTAGFFLLPVLSSYLFRRKLESFTKEFPQFLRMANGLMQSGFDPITAMQTASQDLDSHSQLAIELEYLFQQTKQGVPLQQALMEFGNRLQIPDVELFVHSLMLCSDGAMQLQEIFTRIAKQVEYRYR